MVTTPEVKTQAVGFNCPSCGASISMSTMGWSVNIVCGTCGAILDAQDPNLRVLQQYERRITVTPRIELGTRGNWKGVKWEAVGFQEVTITVDGDDYSWREYVCFNPYHGFIYLSEYDGHWNVIEKMQKRPDVDPERTFNFEFEGKQWKHFQTSRARTTFALGEFPWEVNVGDEVQSMDFIAPPFIMSAEGTATETTWSMGTYTDPEAIGRAFGLKGKLPSPVGVFANQPNPYLGGSKDVGRIFRYLTLALIAMFVLNMVMSRRESVFSRQFKFDRTQGDTTAFITDPFELKGRQSNVEVEIDTDLENDWAYFNLALIDESNGQALDVGREVSYYHGSDSDGSWSEGSHNDNFKLGSVPSGKYILRVAPEGGEPAKRTTSYTLKIRRDVPSYSFYLVALGLLIVPAIFAMAPGSTFESRRWSESDHPIGGNKASSSSDDDDDEK